MIKQLIEGVEDFFFPKSVDAFHLSAFIMNSNHKSSTICIFKSRDVSDQVR